MSVSIEAIDDLNNKLRDLNLPSISRCENARGLLHNSAEHNSLRFIDKDLNLSVGLREEFLTTCVTIYSALRYYIAKYAASFCISERFAV